MRELLSATFSRLFRSKVFWIGLISMFGMAVLLECHLYSTALKIPADMRAQLEGFHCEFWFAGVEMLPFVMAMFIGLFVGSDYSEGTIRNKLAVGHTRSSIYGTNWLVCMVVTVLYHVIYIITVAVLEIVLWGQFYRSTEVLIVGSLLSAFSAMAVSSLLLLLSMLIHNRAVVVVVGVILGFLLTKTGTDLWTALQQTEFTHNYVPDATGNLMFMGYLHNPYYVGGVKRQVYQLLADIHPFVQMIQFDDAKELPKHALLFPVYSVILMGLTSFGGYALFRKQDIK